MAGLYGRHASSAEEISMRFLVWIATVFVLMKMWWSAREKERDALR
jgi:hypothetical protein